MNKILEVSGLAAGYKSKPILTNVNFQVEPGEIIGIIGPNGAGKTTLLKTIRGLLPVQNGIVKIDNIEFGVKHKFNDTTTVNFNAYERNADNMLAFNNTTVKYYNTGEEKSRGWSVDLSQELNKNLNLMVGYTHTTIGTETAKTYANRDGYIPTGAWNISLDYNQDKFNAILSAKGILNRPGRKTNAAKTASNCKVFGYMI